MAVNGGAGNPISFSEIRDFYGDDKDQPVSLSEYNRGGNLVPQTFAGSQTATQNTDITYSNNQATFDDFQVNKSTGTTYSQGSPGSRVLRLSVANGVAFVGAVGSYNVVESDALIFISGTGIRNEGQDVFSTSGTFSTTGVIVDNSSYYMQRIYPGPAYQSGDQNNFSGAAYGGWMGGSPCSTGTVTATSDSHNNGGQIVIYSARRTATTTFDVTLQNTSSTSTYTLTDDSTGTETVYSPGESQPILNDELSEGWLVAYDKVTGSGAGSAGDINVSMVGTFINGSIESAADLLGGGGSSTAPQRMLFNRQAGSTIVNGDRQYGSGSFNFGGDFRSYTVTAADCAIAIEVGVGSGSGGDPPDTPSSNTLTYRINNGSDQTASASGFSTRVCAVQFHGPATPNSTIFTQGGIPQPTQTLAAGDVILLKFLTEETIPGSVRVRRRSQSYITRFTNSSGSETYTLEGGSGKTTGIPSGSIDLNPSGTRDAQTTSSSSPSWEIHFDTSSGNCNTNIPTTVSAGNPINMDLFNAPGTPVG